MPFPLVSHQGLAAPALLVGRRGRVDGVALMAGSLAPDLLYAFVPEADRHVPWSLLWFCVPVALAVDGVFRRWVARPLAVHLPDLGPFRLRDVARAATDRPGPVAAVVSALLGGLSHVVADGFTHPEAWVTDRAPWLYDEVPFPVKGDVYLYNLLRFVGTVGGALLAVLVLWLTARRRAREGMARPVLPAPTARSARWLWAATAVGAVVAAGIVLNSWSTPYDRPQAVMRATLVVAVAVTLGCRAAGNELARDTGADPAPLSRAGSGWDR
jgi:hypothetical protein